MIEPGFHPQPGRLRSSVRYGLQVLSGGPRYCFVIGCPRSGTTALTRLLHSHPEVVIGLERYRVLLRGLDKRDGLSEFGPPQFRPGRFLKFRSNDTNITPDHHLAARHYEVAAERFTHGRVRVVGDKVPPAGPIVLALARQFRDARFVFVFRDLEAVAGSYCRRARDPNDHWPAEAGARQALIDWHDAFDAADALEALVGPDRLLVVCYETLFSGNHAAFEALFAWLGVGVHNDATAAFEATTESWSKRVDHSDELTPQDRAFLEANSDDGMFQRYRERAQRGLMSTPS